MQVTPLAIPDVLLLEPKVFGNDCGFFLKMEVAKIESDSFKAKKLAQPLAKNSYGQYLQRLLKEGAHP